MKLKTVMNLENMKNIMLESFKNTQLKIEKIPAYKSMYRILAASVKSACNVPHFDRSVVDGYAVKICDVQGASEGIPVVLKLIGKAEMGEQTEAILCENTCVYVPTGGMMPEAADAMVMIEYTENLSDDEILIYSPASKNQNVLKAGDDIKKGEVVFEKGKKIYPQDIGALTSIGVLEVDVFCAPKVTIISTGDEIVSPEQNPPLGKIRDINSFSLSAKIESWGGEIVEKTVIEDDYNSIKCAVQKAMDSSDIVFLSGGSSVGEKDYTLDILGSFENSEVLINGLNVKPGKPTIVANVNDKPIIGLPGQPASAFLVLDQMLDILYQIYYGNLPQKPFIIAELDQNVAASTGRKTLQMVTLEEKYGTLVAKVLRGKSGMITLITQAFGYIVIEENSEGKEAGQKVKVYPLR